MVAAYRPATADGWMASRCTAPLWDVTPAERTNAISTGIVMIGVIDLNTGTITVTCTGTTTRGTATMVSATGDTTDHIRKGLGVEVRASATGDTTDHIRKGPGVEVRASATGDTTDHIRKGLGVEVPASATATAARQPPMVSGTSETDHDQSR
jgi:hypothetical protein